MKWVRRYQRFGKDQKGVSTLEFLIGSAALAAIALAAFVFAIQPVVEEQKELTPDQYEADWYQPN